MLSRSHNNLKWLEFNLLQEIPQLKARVYQRQGGTSLSPYNSLNLASNVGDDPKHVEENLELLKDSIGTQSLIAMDQVHGTRVRPVDTPPQTPPQCDALITNRQNLTLIIKHADCQPTLLVDPILRVIAAVHCGWRGSCQNIYKETIQMMRDLYGCKPENLLVGIGPSLGPCHAEFINYKKEIPEIYWEYQSEPNYFDFWAISQTQLLEQGVLPHHIEIAAICTVDSPDFFSYRQQKITGRNGTLIQI